MKVDALYGNDLMKETCGSLIAACAAIFKSLSLNPTAHFT